MVKSVIKEFFILILLLAIIVLLFAIILYDYNPLNKTIPQKVAEYSLPRDVKKELETTINEEERIIKTYTVDGTDLSRFKKEDEYNPGKVAPYSLYNTTISGEVGGNQVDPQDPPSGGVFFNNAGK